MKNFTLLVLLCIFAQSADAGECDLAEGPYSQRLDLFVLQNCYDKIPEFLSLRNRVRAETADKSASADTRFTKAMEIMVTLHDDLAALAASGEQASQAQGHAKEIVTRINAASLELGKVQMGEVTWNATDQWLVNKWEPGAGTSDTEWYLLKESLFETGCYPAPPSNSKSRCDSLFSDYMINVRFIVAMDIVSDYVLDIPAKERIERKEYVHRQWTSYFDDQQYQFWWEMNANYCLFNPRLSDDIGALKRSICLIPIAGPLMARRWSQSTADIGWVAPPNKRFIYLHPDIGFIYVGNEPSGNKFAPALVMQWLGYLRWHGYDADTGKMNNAYGISIVSTYADLIGSKSVGFGLMGHYRQYGLSVTRHGDEWAVYLNLNFVKGFQDAEKRASDLMGKFDEFKQSLP